MGLADRLVHMELVGDVLDEVGDIPTMTFAAAFSLWCSDLAERSEVISVFNLTSADLTALDAMKAVHDAKATQAEKNAYVARLQCAGIFYELGKINSTRYAEIMEL